MKFFDSIARAFGYEKRDGGQLGGPSIISAFGYGQTGSPLPTVHNMQDYLMRYANQAWVFACINIIKTKGASVPLKVYQKNGDKMTELPDHPLKRLLDSVNPWMNGYDLRESTHGFIELTGNHYWLLDAFIDGKPTEIYPLNPKRVKVKADKDKYVVGYTYEIVPGKIAATFDPSEILHFKTWSPIDDYYGLPPLSAARFSSDSMMEADAYNLQFFKAGAIPGGILSSDKSMTEEGKARIRTGWKKLHGGTRKSHEIAVLEGGLKYEQVASTQGDMQFKELKDMTIRDVLAVYGVQPVMVGLHADSNYTNATEQRRSFWIDAMLPRLAKIESVINERLVKPYADDVIVAYDTSVVEDLHGDAKLRAESDQTLVSAGILTINEAREKRQLPPVDWGDTWNAPMGLSSIEGRDEPVAPGGETEDPNAPTEQPPAEENPEGKSVSAPTLPAPVLDGEKRIREVVWLKFKGITENLERRWFPTLRQLFSAQEKEVIHNVRNSDWGKMCRQVRLDGFRTLKANVQMILFDRTHSRKVFQKEGKRLIEITLATKAKEEIDDYGLGIDFNVRNHEVTAWIQTRAFKFSDQVNSTTEADLRRNLEEAVKGGESLDQVEQRIADVFDIARGSRTRMIARTEVVSASNQGAISAYEQSGVVAKIEWVSSRDDKVRDEHQIDGERIDLGEKFSNGLAYPGDPAGEASNVINCRCTTAPITSGREDQ